MTFSSKIVKKKVCSGFGMYSSLLNGKHTYYDIEEVTSSIQSEISQELDMKYVCKDIKKVYCVIFGFVRKRSTWHNSGCITGLIGKAGEVKSMIIHQLERFHIGKGSISQRPMAKICPLVCILG